MSTDDAQPVLDETSHSAPHMDNVNIEGVANIDPNLSVRARAGGGGAISEDAGKSQHPDVFPTLAHVTDSAFIHYIGLWS